MLEIILIINTISFIYCWVTATKKVKSEVIVNLLTGIATVLILLLVFVLAPLSLLYNMLHFTIEKTKRT